MKNFRFGSTFFLLTIFAPSLVAQYYEQPFEHTPDRFIYGGYFQRTFEPRYSNPLPDSQRVNYRRVMPVIGFRQGLVDVTFGYTRFSLRGQDKTSIHVSVTVANEFPVVTSSSHALFFPLMLSSDYTRTDNTGTDKENFNIGSVGLGAGLKYLFKKPRFQFSISAVEAVHWSFEGYNTGTGFSPATLGEALFVFKDALILDGIALGYRFRYQTWNMNEDKFNYKALSHGAFVGVMF